jgi:hypothetical protein
MQARLFFWASSAPRRSNPGGWGLPPMPPTLWQVTQLLAAPWSWHAAQAWIFTRASRP